MFVYIFTSFLVLFFFKLEVISRNRNLNKLLFLVASFVVAFILVFRGDNVGGDTIHYCRFFDGKGSGYGTIDNPDYLIDLGFIWYCKFLRFFSSNRAFFLIITSLVTIMPFLYIIYRDSKYKLLPLCFYMLSFNLLTLSQTALRQNVSLSLLFVVYIIFTSKNINGVAKYLVILTLTIFAFYCHSTSIVSVFMAIIVYFIPLRRWSTLLILFVVLGLMILRIDITGYVFSIFYDNSNVTDMTHYITGYADDINENKFSLMSLLQILMLASVAFLCSDKLYYDKNRYNFIMKCFFIGGAITVMGNGFVLICRIVYFLTFLGATISIDNYNGRKMLIPRLGLYLCLIALFFYQILYLSTQKSAIIHDHMIPYSFIFE